jgi:hypothetical protein
LQISIGIVVIFIVTLPWNHYFFHWLMNLTSLFLKFFFNRVPNISILLS